MALDELFVPLASDEQAIEELTNPSILPWHDALRRFRCNIPAMAALGVLAVIFLMAIIGPWLTPYTYYEIHLIEKNLPPSETHWLGTDDLGRDLFARLWYGARISLFVGFAAALIDLMIGVAWGGISGWFGGWIDMTMMRLADVVSGLPYLLLVILLIVIFGTGLFPILLAMTLTGWISMARIVRGQVLQLKKQEYIVAARALGASTLRILTHHMLPNAVGPIFVMVTLTVPTAIFTEAFLSFLGLGVQAPIASWGTMANDGLSAMTYYPWRLFIPAAAITITLLALNIVGDGLRDALDPHLQKEF